MPPALWTDLGRDHIVNTKTKLINNSKLQAIIKEYSPFFILLALFLFMTILKGGTFFSPSNLTNIVRQQRQFLRLFWLVLVL